MRKSILLFVVNQSKSYPIACRGLRTKTSEKVEPVQNEKLVKIAVIGTPNAGKSTFINNLLNHRVSGTELPLNQSLCNNLMCVCIVNRFVQHLRKFTQHVHLQRPLVSETIHKSSYSIHLVSSRNNKSKNII